MKRFALIIATTLLMAVGTPFLVPVVAAQTTPHQTAGMVGRIALACLATPPVEKGILLRAYWIGLIGIAVTLLWVVISYYIIKSSSHLFKDHAEHVRRGLP